MWAAACGAVVLAASLTNEPWSVAQGLKIVPVVCRAPVGTEKGYLCLPGARCEANGAGYNCVTAAGTRTAAGRYELCTGVACCSDGLFCNGEERWMPGAAGADYRGCVAASGPACGPNATCNEALDTCTGNCTDRDRDGHSDARCGGDDCDDNDLNRYPGNPEVCDAAGHDEDCNPCTIASTTSADGDADRDGFVSGACSNPFAGTPPQCNTAAVVVDAARGRVAGRDCDDRNASVVPGTMVCGPRGVLVCAAVGPASTGAAPVNGWYERACPGTSTCFAQPNGTGVCLR